MKVLIVLAALCLVLQQATSFYKPYVGYSSLRYVHVTRSEEVQYKTILINSINLNKTCCFILTISLMYSV